MECGAIRMLHELRIENIAVVERAEIQFGPGLNVLTGETGAGKSIIIDSIAAVTGARVSRELIRSGADRATVTAVFDSSGILQWLRENEIDSSEEELIIQRRITSDGKSSCRINGYPVSVAQLRALGSFLLELHGQNDGLQLMDEKNHLAALDRFAGLDLLSYTENYQKLCILQKQREQFIMDEAEKEHLSEVLSDTIAELERSDLKEGERDGLITRRDLLRNAEKLTEALHAARDLLNKEEGALSCAQDAAWHCRRAASYSADLAEASEHLDQAVLLLSDADESLRDFEESMDFSPEEYDRIEQRLKDLNRLERKYRRSLDELPCYLEECRIRLEEISLSEEKLQKLNLEIQRQLEYCQNLAQTLHQKRVDASFILAGQIEKELQELSMPSARFQVELSTTDDLGPTGIDTARFLLAANLGEEPGRISRIASGGELSRIMLAMKNVLSQNDPVPTMIFDEIDTGVSGVAAQRVGEKLTNLSNQKQVLCVTHLPQIAAMADSHYVIVKKESDQRTLTDVILLDHDGRCREIARLHGGENITQITLRSAEEQLDYAERYKTNMKEKYNGSV